MLLERLGLPFEVVGPTVDESPTPTEGAEQLVRRLALAKALAVARGRRGALVIGADQVALHAGTIVGKPGNHARAVEQLRRASGTRVTLHTGLALVNSDTGQSQSDVVPFAVVFRRLTEEQIERYLRREQPYDCAGAVKAEGLGITLLERLEGNDPSALIGLPLIRLTDMLAREGVALP